MNISTKGQYALIALVDLAVSTKEGHETVKNISKRQNISENYLEQIFMSLKKAKLIKSIRGPQGGYLLGRSADEITAGEILRTVEGPLTPVKCIAKGKEKSECSLYDFCVTRLVWGRVSNLIDQVTDDVTLTQLADCYVKQQKVQELHYDI